MAPLSAVIISNFLEFGLGDRGPKSSRGSCCGDQSRVVRPCERQRGGVAAVAHGPIAPKIRQTFGGGGSKDRTFGEGIAVDGGSEGGHGGAGGAPGRGGGGLAEPGPGEHGGAVPAGEHHRVGAGAREGPAGRTPSTQRGTATAGCGHASQPTGTGRRRT